MQYGVSFVASVVAWDTVAGSVKTGDAANISTSWLKDGVRSASTNSCTEVDATNFPGVYDIVITATEAQCLIGVAGGKSSTAGILIIPSTYGFIQYPTNFSSLGIYASGRVKASMDAILDTLLTEGAAGRLTGGFKQFFNVASPASTMELITAVTTVSTVTNGVGLANGAITTVKFGAGAIDNTVIAANANTAIAAAILAATVEGSISLKQATQIILAAEGGKLLDNGTGTVTIRNASDTANAIVATYDATGRLTVTLTYT